MEVLQGAASEIMSPSTFNALLVTKTSDGQFTREVVEQPLENLPAGDVLIQVQYSSLNYKDALSATGHPGVTKKFPHIPGIDAAGTIVTSTVNQFQPGDAVIVTGFDLGMNTWGGFAEYIRVPADWVVPLPAGMTLRESMIVGTAGLTAALCVDALLRQNLSLSDGDVLVTGATGGVGSLAISILSLLGYSVVAVTGKPTQHAYLQSLGARAIASRADLIDQSSKPLISGRWAGVVDTVGGPMLATAIKSTKYGGSVTACGLVGGTELNTTVYPFILRGVSLIGIDSVHCPIDRRLALWKKLATDWKPPQLDNLVTTVTLPQVSAQVDTLLAGKNVGRVLVAL